MRIHAIQTGTVAIKTRQVSGRGPGALRPYITLLDTTWTEPLPIYAWVIEHPEGLIVVDTGERTRLCLRGAGAAVTCTALVTASNRERADNIRALLVCAPVRARRESPSATWATRSFGSFLG